MRKTDSPHQVIPYALMLLCLIAGNSHAQPPTPPIPSEGGTELHQWLQAGHYKAWRAESKVHHSAGPHFGSVRAYLNRVLFESMNNSQPQQPPQHPQGAAAVKELYGDGDQVRGWAVAIKTAADSNGGNNWYWYEIYDDETVRDGQGIPLCYGCHSAGRDYVLTPWPLQ